MKRLTLKKDVLAPLTDRELGSVVGGTEINTETIVCWLFTDPCINPPHSEQLTCGCA